MTACEEQSPGGDPFPLRPETLVQFGLTAEAVGIVIVDHGSRRDESNQMLERLATMFQQRTGWPIVEPAHMELAEPSIATAFGRAVARGARLVVVHPYLLAPGRHWREDIPRLAAEAGGHHEGVRHLVTAPLGLHPLMAEVIHERIMECLRQTLEKGDHCERST
jgi:sirohydrochlorin ferrochelatase